MRVRRLLLPSLSLAALVTAGCDASSGGATTSSSAATSAPASGRSSASASPSPSVTAFAASCETALSVTAVSEAAGQPVIGRTAFVVGEADATIGRLAYLNCRYGLPEATPAPTAAAAAAPVPAVEIGVSLYDSADRATARVAGTAEDYTSTGSKPTEVPVGSSTGTLLVKSGEPATIVVADGSRTVAVSVAGAFYTGSAQIVAIAALALDQAV